MKVLNWIAGILVIIGALNWGLVGFLNLNLVTTIVSSMPEMHNIERIIYCAVGISGIWMIFFAMRCCCKRS